MKTALRHALLLVGTLLASACGRTPSINGGNPDGGRLLLRQFGCGDCHRITGVATAEGVLGPPLDGMATRVYLAGRLPNSPPQMAAFIRDPQGLVPGTTMPDLQVGEAHARDMVAWLWAQPP